MITIFIKQLPKIGNSKKQMSDFGTI